MEKPPTALILYAAALLTSFNKSSWVRNQSLKLSFGLIHVFQQDHDWTLNRFDSKHINRCQSSGVQITQMTGQSDPKKKKKEKCVLIQIRNPLCSLAHTVNQISQNQQINNTISDVLKRLCKTLTVFYCFILKQWVFALKKSENSIFSFY